MYDSIVQESPLLPPGVNLAAVLEGCGEAEVAEVVQMLPSEGRVSAAALVAAGALSSGLGMYDNNCNQCVPLESSADIMCLPSVCSIASLC